MKKKHNFSTSVFESILEDATSKIVDSIEEELDIITFCEHPFYLNQPLHGAERFVLKVFYNLPLDNTNKYINIRSYPFDKKGVMFTEVEYANFLIAQGRTNLLTPQNINSCTELILACGRRSGKTFIASIISSYEAYKLIIKGDPQRYYKLPQGELIKIINIASTSDQALILAKATQNRILNSKWFLPYVESKTQSEIRLRTKRDLELLKEEVRYHGKALDQHASILVEALACTARGIRGHTVIVAILDEVAHYIDNDGNRSGEVIYEAVSPSIATFGMDGKILCVSSPYSKSGIFYSLFLQAKGSEKEPGDQNKRMFQLPTWEMNDTITFEFLDSERARNPESFNTEFGAEFSAVAAGFFKFPEKIDAAIKRHGESSVPMLNNVLHYIAVDPSSKGNGYCLCMVHVELREIEKEGVKSKEQIVVVDKWKKWTLESNDSESYDLEYIDSEIVENYIFGLCNRFKIAKIVYDQYDSSSAVNKLKKRGYDAQKTPFTRNYNMKIYGKLRSMFYESKMDLFQCEEGVAELKALQEIKVGKREFKVEAPTQGTIVEDDLADVLANATYIATDKEILQNTASITGTRTNKYANSYLGYQRRLTNNKISTNLMKAKNAGLVGKKCFGTGCYR